MVNIIAGDLKQKETQTFIVNHGKSNNIMNHESY